MAKVIRLIEAELINFAGLRNQKVQYGNLTALSGRNGEGKTTIGTEPVWVLWGKDLFGNDYTKDKFSPRPSNYKYDRVYASILLSVDGTEYKFAREIDGKKNNFYVNDIPKSATDFNAAVAALIDQDEFMSLYFPAYFFNLHWTKQRELLMAGAAAPLTKTVLAQLTKPQADKLSEQLKKVTLDDLEAKHKAEKPKLDKAVIAAESRTRTLQEQLERWPRPSDKFSLEEANKEAAELLERIKNVEKITDSADENNRRINTLNARIQSLQEQISDSAKGWPDVKGEPINDTCRTCKRKLNEDAIEAVIADKELRKAQYQTKHKSLVDQRKSLELERDTLQYIDVAEQLELVRSLEQERRIYLDAIRDKQEWDRLSSEVEVAAAAEAATLASQRETTFILDAIKAYRAKEAELQAEEIQAKFTRLSVRLFDYVKSSDEYKPTFSIQMDGKDFISLSTGEKIAAGLELIEVLHNQSGLIAPVFVDGIGEYTGKLVVYDQVITGRAVPDQNLKIEVDGVEV